MNSQHFISLIQIFIHHIVPSSISVFSPVSYTHLDVYKRQVYNGILFSPAHFLDCKLPFDKIPTSLQFALIFMPLIYILPKFVPHTTIPVSYTHLVPYCLIFFTDRREKAKYYRHGDDNFFCNVHTFHCSDKLTY